MENKKLRIGVDIDEVVVEFFREYLILFNEKFNKNLKFDDVTKFEIWALTDVSKEDALNLVENFYSSGGLSKLCFVEGAKRGLEKISENYEIYFVTSRPENTKQETMNFFYSHFPEDNYKIVFSGGVWGDFKTKKDLCNENEIKILIEDRRRYALDCANSEIKVLLLDKPWNQDCEHKNIIRVKDWNEIMKEIEEWK